MRPSHHEHKHSKLATCTNQHRVNLLEIAAQASQENSHPLSPILRRSTIDRHQDIPSLHSFEHGGERALDYFPDLDH
eukprot:395647-Hanusia_phi.AAC.2